ncbi:Cloroperoxidase [Rhizoclosmatium globosum]|uniref:Cloroperoxidase n=1 Tax=Rhizoclosmatium globosum TaxID=329046 RepID=A0A1Y2C9D6_9FUNG|nr:Cloroperoxidase [Rhizoclosmatium globosum]|eukprot:ORY43639.1 Cloroperoxidase [Rhizoclosmatium globosum]
MSVAPESEPEVYGKYIAPGPDHVRSPCPAVNVLANHGYLPRDGKNITKPMIIDALKKLYNLSEKTGAFLADTVMDPENPLGVRPPGQEKDGIPYIHLNQLSTHNKMEHDVSLFHVDAALGDHTIPQPEMISTLISTSKDGRTITWKELARYKSWRYYENRKKNPVQVYTRLQMFTSWAEAAILTLVLAGGGKKDLRIPVDWVKEFVGEERIPDGWKRSEVEITGK